MLSPMDPIPPFKDDGLLPAGDFAVTIPELKASSLVLGPGDPAQWPDWDGHWRERLVDNLEVLVEQLWRVGITEIFVDGCGTTP